MLGLFSRPKRKPGGNVPRRSRPTLELLEARDCPASPTINLTAVVRPGHLVELSGSVTDDNPAGVMVTFSGVVSGTTFPDASGHFDYTTPGGSLGLAYAVGVDQQNQSTNTAQAAVWTAAPTMTLSLSYGTQHTVTLSGQVTDIDPGGRTVTFTGVVSASVTTNADGTFSWTGAASQLGTVQATTTDLWSQTSNPVQVTVSNPTPVINNFTGSQGLNRYWTFSGSVTDNHPAGLTVQLGGIPALKGKTATVRADGTFSITVQLAVGEEGTATADVTDWWGAAAETVGWYVSQN
jgi:hypothetical protein